jgi:hypothetical protein
MSNELSIRITSNMRISKVWMFLKKKNYSAFSSRQNLASLIKKNTLNNQLYMF